MNRTRLPVRGASLFLALLPNVTPAATASDSMGIARPISAVIEDYVQHGSESSLTLENQRLQAQQSEMALRAAQARLRPEVSINSRYTVNSGGREITVPIDELLNPAYQTLNQLLVSMGQPARFSMLTPSGLPLLRAREQDTHLSLRQPLYAPGLLDGIEANRAAAEAAQLGSVAALRTQRRDITHAYLITQKARAASLIVAGSVNILQENLRINESLYANGKITQDAVLRARAELLSATQQRIEADQGRDQAQRALNLLLNRPLESVVEDAAPGDDATLMALLNDEIDSANTVVERARRTRPELQQLRRATESAEAQLRAAQSRRGPTVALGVDTGVQGENFGTGPRYNYLSGSLLLEWTIFDGGARSASIASARLAARQTDNLRQLAEQKIEMEARAALDAALAARESLAAAQARAAAASAAFRIASRKRDEGAATQIEFLDVRNALTTAELNLAWTRLDLIERRADLQFAAGSGTELLGAAP
jgi:outer membrane protein TolC